MPHRRIYDPEVEAAAKSIPMLDLSDADGARQTVRDFGEQLAAKGITRPTDENIEEIESAVPRSGNGSAIPVRIYKPGSPGDLHGAFVNFHSGEFVLGDLESEHARCLAISRSLEIPVIGVDYRLAPEHPFPAGVNDCFDVLAWVSANAGDLGIDPARIAVGGGSAGGALSAAVSLMARDRGGPAIACQLLLYPVIDNACRTESMLDAGDCYVWNYQNNLDMWRQYLGDTAGPVSPYAAPARATDLTNLPPAYISTCEHDPLRDEGIQFAIRLMNAGVLVDLENFAGTVHAFDLLTPSAVADRAMTSQIAYLRRALATAT